MGAEDKEAAATAQEHADKLNAIAGEATKKLNDAKKHQEEVAAKAHLKEKAEEKAAASKKASATKIKNEADAALKEANEKKAAAEGMLAKIKNAKCAKHSGCSALGNGYGCPTLDFAKMHLGSAKLDGVQLACCGVAEELATTPSLDRQLEASNHDFGVISLLVAAATGSLVTALVLQMSTRKEDKKGYVHLTAE